MSAAIPISLPHVLSHYLTAQQYRRYVKSEHKNQFASPQHYYNTALRDLSIRDTESAIYNLIKVFEIDPRHLPSLHLARTMLFGLNKLFHEAGGELLRTKHPNLNTWRLKLEKSLQEKELEMQRLRNEIQLHQPKGIWRLLDRWFGQWRRKKIAELEARLGQIPGELRKLQKERTQATKLAQLQEYANVISLLLEVCMFPARYSWITEGKSEEEAREQVWYG